VRARETGSTVNVMQRIAKCCYGQDASRQVA
jgi:hypothetical protein